MVRFTLLAAVCSRRRLFSPPSVLAAGVVLLSSLAGPSAYAQTNWQKGIAYKDKTFSLSSGPGQTNSADPATDLKVKAVYVSSLPQGANDAAGGTIVYQPYTWTGGLTKTPLNVQINVGASGSGTGSYQATSTARFILSPNNSVVASGSAPPSYNYLPNVTTVYIPDAASGSSGKLIGQSYIFTAYVSADARLYGSGGSAMAEANVLFGQPI